MNQYSQTRRMITAFFDDRTEASRAVDALRNAGISDSAIRMIEGEGSASSTAAHEDRGFFAMLGDLFMPADDRDTYAEGLRRGGYVVSVDAREGEEDTVIDILDVEGSVDLDSRSSEWEAEGWTRSASSGYDRDATGMGGAGYAAGGAGLATGTTDTGVHTGRFTEDHASGRAEGVVPVTGAGMAQGSSERHAGMAHAGHSEMRDGDRIQVAAEELRVGKRDVSHGRVRVRSYVVEEPVSESVALRSEHVEVSRRPVDRPATDADRLFQERSIEVEERAEEAVVSKDARIVEEIEVGKVAQERVETVSDTVRRTEVEIDDQRSGGTLRSGTYADDDRTLMDSIKGGLGMDDDSIRGGSSSR